MKGMASLRKTTISIILESLFFGSLMLELIQPVSFLSRLIHRRYSPQQPYQGPIEPSRGQLLGPRIQVINDVPGAVPCDRLIGYRARHTYPPRLAMGNDFLSASAIIPTLTPLPAP